jgi:hypothetical protein
MHICLQELLFRHFDEATFYLHFHFHKVVFEQVQCSVYFNSSIYANDMW